MCHGRGAKAEMSVTKEFVVDPPKSAGRAVASPRWASVGVGGVCDVGGCVCVCVEEFVVDPPRSAAWAVVMGLSMRVVCGFSPF